MIWTIVLTGFLLSLQLISGPESQTPVVSTLRQPSPLADEALADSSFYEQVANPQLTSEEDIRRRVAEYQSLLDRTGKTPPALDPDANRIRDRENAARLLDRFLDFAASDSARDRVVTADGLAIQMPRDLEPGLRQQIIERIQNSYAEMIEKWRTEIGLDLPSGFIFVKLYESREEMASDYGLGPETAGVAFPCRYIAMALPFQERDFWGSLARSFIGEEFEQTMAHEFVHAFCFMTLGYERAGGLPRWFQEGFALHFSGERHVRTAIGGPGGMTIRDFGSTKEYQEFKRLFQFVSEKYGREPLYDFARRSLEQGTVDAALPQVLGLSGEPALLGATVAWWQDKARFQQRSIIVVLFLISISFLLFRGRWIGLRWVAALFFIWAAMLHAAVSPYYIHTSLWWAPGALTLPLGFFMVRFARRHRASEPAMVRLIVARDWPRLDEVMQPWPYEMIDLAEIAASGAEAGWPWGERDIAGSAAARLQEFLEAQPTDFFYYHGHAYRVWYEPLSAPVA